MWAKDVEPTESALTELKRAVKSDPTCNLLKLLGDACSSSTDRHLSASAAAGLKVSVDVAGSTAAAVAPPVTTAPQERKSLFSRMGQLI